MKKIVLFSAFVAALFLASCVKETQQTPAALETVQFHTLETKTVFTDPVGTTYPVLWTDNDSKVAVTMNYATTHVKATVTPSEDYKRAKFSADFDKGSATSFTFQAVSPESAVKSINETNKTLNLEVPAAQTCTAGSPDEKAMLLYATTEAVSTFPDAVELEFKHFTGYLHFVFTNYDVITTAGATVNSVSISSTENIAGRRFLWSTGSVTVNTSSQVVTVATSSLDNVWAGLAPVDLSGKTLTLTVSTDKGTLTKEITLPASANLTSGTIAKMTVSLSGIALVEPVVYDLVTDASQLHIGDKIIITAANYDRAISTTQNGNNRSGTSVTKGTGTILDPSDAVEIITLEDGVVPGEYALKATAGYLYAAGGSSNNYLRTAAPADITDATAPLGSWNIQILDGQSNGTGDGLHEPAEGTTDNVAMIHTDAVPRGYIFYNTNGGGGTLNLFSAYVQDPTYYTSFLHIYRLHGQAVAKHFNVKVPAADSDGKVTVSAAGGELKVNVFADVAWTATGTAATLLDATSGTGNKVITLAVPANTGAERSYQLVVSTTAEVTTQSYNFTITQLAPSTGGASVGDVLWEEWWEGSSNNELPSAYCISSDKTTTVYGGGSVTYTQSPSSGSMTQMKDDALVYYKSKPSNCNSKYVYNLLVRSQGGYLNAAGIPCPGVKTATLTYRSNQGVSNHSVSTSTSTVTVGSLSASTGQTLDSSNKKNLYTITCSISIPSGVDEISLRITNPNTGTTNIRVDGIELKVTEVW